MVLFMKIKISPANPAHLNFIIDTWLRTYRRASAVKGIPSQIYYPNHREVALEIISRTNANVASSIDDDDQLFGYILFETSKTPTIHYAYVKQIFRKLGLANQLLESTGINTNDLYFYSHETYASKYILNEFGIFNPYEFFKRRKEPTNEIQTTKSTSSNPYGGWLPEYANEF